MAAITNKIRYLLFKINRERLDQKSIQKNFFKGIKIDWPKRIYLLKSKSNFIGYFYGQIIAPFGVLIGSISVKCAEAKAFKQVFKL